MDASRQELPHRARPRPTRPTAPRRPDDLGPAVPAGPGGGARARRPAPRGGRGRGRRRHRHAGPAGPRPGLRGGHRHRRQGLRPAGGGGDRALRPDGGGGRSRRLDADRGRREEAGGAPRPGGGAAWRSPGTRSTTCRAIPGVGRRDRGRAGEALRFRRGDAGPDRGDPAGRLPRRARSCRRRSWRWPTGSGSTGRWWRSRRTCRSRWDPADLARRPVDTERARALFTELEFGRLLRDLPRAQPPSAEPPGRHRGGDHAGGARRGRGRGPAAPARWGCAPPSPRRRRGRIPPAGLALAAGGRSLYVPIEHRYLGAPAQLAGPEVAAALRPLLDDPAVEIHAHDLKAEIHALRHLGLPAPARGIDTELASHLLLTARREHALADVARERLGVELPPAPADAGKGRRGPGHVPGGGDGGPRRGRRGRSSPPWRRRSSGRSATTGSRALHDEIERPLVPVLARDGAGRHRRRLGGHGGR